MQGNLQKAKIVFLGDMSVGKTSVINRFVFDSYTGNEQVIINIYIANCWGRFRFKNLDFGK